MTTAPANDADYLRELANRLERISGDYGVDDPDLERLRRIATMLDRHRHRIDRMLSQLIPYRTRAMLEELLKEVSHGRSG